MSIDLTPEFLTTIDLGALERDVLGQIDTGQTPAPSQLDRTMDRILRSRALWIAPVLIVQAVLSIRLIIDVGGQPMMRLTSTGLVLSATVFIYLATRRMFGQGAALLAGAVLALNATTLLAGSLASRDARAVALLGASLWLAVSCAARARRAIVLGPCLVGAVATTYLALPFVVGVVLVLAVYCDRVAGAARARRCVTAAIGSLVGCAVLAILAATSVGTTGALSMAAGHQLITATATAALRHQVVTDVGPLLVVGAFGALLAGRNRILAVLLVATAVVPMVVQAHAGTTDPTRDCCELVLVFIAPAVGVTGMALLRRGPLLGLRVPLAIIGMVVLLASGIASSSQMLRDWPSGFDAATSTPASDVSTLGVPGTNDLVGHPSTSDSARSSGASR
jgi:hypothetical protein